LRDSDVVAPEWLRVADPAAISEKGGSSVRRHRHPQRHPCGRGQRRRRPARRGTGGPNTSRVSSSSLACSTPTRWCGGHRALRLLRPRRRRFTSSCAGSNTRAPIRLEQPAAGEPVQPARPSQRRLRKEPDEAPESNAKWPSVSRCCGAAAQSRSPAAPSSHAISGMPYQRMTRLTWSEAL
jgi:hypothetical protein